MNYIKLARLGSKHILHRISDSTYFSINNWLLPIRLTQVKVKKKMAISGRAKEDQKYDGSSLKVAIVHARWNEEVIDSLVTGCVNRLKELGVKENNIIVESVPGSYELPVGVASLAKEKDVDAIVAIGCLIKGDTMHFEYISEAVSNQLMSIQFKIGKPVIFGLLTCLTYEQAKARAGLIPGVAHNHGVDWGECAVEMVVKYGKGLNSLINSKD